MYNRSDTVVVVTGAARGIGRGIARVLGETGATVYVTDIEARGRKTSTLPGTVEDTAEQVTARGGKGIAVPLDHTDDRAVEALFARIRDEHGGIDLLVANACNGNALPFQNGPFWTLPLANWRNMIDIGVRSHLVSAWYAAPLLMERKGLVVLTGYTDPNADVMGNLFYDLAMSSVSRLARSLARDFRSQGVAAVALSPGFTRTEAIIAAIGERPPGSDSIEFPGRAVKALFADPDVQRYSGQTLRVADVAVEYGFRDIDPSDESLQDSTHGP